MVGPKDSEPRPIRRREPVKPKEEKAGRPRTGLVEKQKQWALRAGPGRQRSRRHNSYRVKSWADGRGHGGRGEGGGDGKGVVGRPKEARATRPMPGNKSS
jgi:hypothetical protein